MKFQLPRGMRDLEPDEYEDMNVIRNAFIESARIFNFILMEPSPLELLTTLEAKSGPSITKEIYNFVDKGNRKIALRFDLTIGLTRYFVSRRDLKIPTKIASFGGVWRYDEPQAGRYRFFHQWDIEIYGPSIIESDTEIIEFTSIFLQKLGLRNILIDISSRNLIEEYIKNIIKISDDEELFEIFRAIDKIPKKGKDNVLKEYNERIDSKVLEKVINFAEKKGSFKELDGAMKSLKLKSWTEIEKINRSLSNKGINNIRINLGIVRGLDYYSGLVFEAVDTGNNLGSLVGGGRYNKLTDAFGRKEVGAIGAAGGVERIVLAMKQQGAFKKDQNDEFEDLNYVVYDSIEIFDNVERLASSLRRNNFPVDYDLLGRSFSKQIAEAENRKSKKIIILSKENLEKKGQVILRDAVKKIDKKINIIKDFDELINELVKIRSR
ncbi:histidine--tRNA ligase [Candidatus Nitrosocosmicus sp. T]